MKLIRFKDTEGKLIAAVNPDHIISAVPSKDGYISLHTHAGVYEVQQCQFEKAMEDSGEELSRINNTMGRLITALDRLTIHIPTSIRMHL